ncbi:MAG: carboxypeptidase-like regulatory domain-containing protein, partial [Bacteroidales bacterium]|nr:carboxypeptidase-like regulatory domain-containing protein [Bacteroidales bacterium]
GVCPNGWHLPSEAEWQELYDTLGGNDRDAGAQLASLFYSDGKPIAESEYTGASGFDVIYSNWYSGSYEGNYENAAFWSATASNTDEAYYHRIYSGSPHLLSGSSERGYGFNVRCVKGTTYYTFDTIPYCGESYTFGTQVITESGDYTRIVNLGEDTDSIYKLHITFVEIPVATISDFSNGCFGQNNGHATVSVEGGTAPYSYAWNTPEAHTGATLSNLAEGEYTVIVTDANGCSATSSIEITTPDEIAVSIADTACNSYEWNGTTYTETGEYTQTLQTAEGCDSVVTLRLTINHSSTGEFADLMCAGVPYTYGNETFNEAGTYTVTLTNSVGCDSVVTLTLTYADNCNGIISGVITDDYTGDFIPNARVTIGNNVTYTNAEGQYSLEVLRGRKTLRVSAVEYISHSEIIDIQGDTTINIALNSPRIITSDNISLTTYPYLEQTDTITITNTGNGTLVWSSITEYEGLALLEDSTIQRRNTRSLWDSIQTFATRDNAEQAVATDGFFIYTSSWMRPGEFNRYTPSGEYVETFFIENVGMIRNLSYNGNYFYGTDATNVILKLDLDNQTLLGSIETDIPEIRHCSFNRLDGSILAGDWNSLYRIDTTSGTSQQIRSDLANVYSSAFDNLSAGGPYLWLFSQTSQDNGPSACIRQFDISANDFTDKIHYLDDIEISDASLAGGICASEYVCEGKFVLLANVQNPSGSNTIATYEIGRTNSVARAERKSGSIAPSESESIPVRASATETGEYASTIRYRAAVMGRQSNDVIVNISAIAPECDAVQRITATTDNSTITLEWSPVELGEYESVSYLVYNTSSQYAIDTLSDTSVTYRGLPLCEHCFYVRALSSAGYTCLSEASDTVCAEIKDSPCDIPLFVEARSDGETITVSWNTHADVDHFNIYKDGESIAENLTTTTFVDTDVVPETDYCYTVVAHLNNALCDEISETTCMRILTGVCTEAPVLTADAIGNSVILKWTECEGAVSYRIFRDNEFVGTTTDISYTDNVHEAGNYCYVVESDCEHRMYKLSNEECVFADAIAELSADDITLYPNPTYSQFFIEGQHIAIVQIYNTTGQLITEIENTEAERITINCDGWNPGIYNIRIISVDGETATRKVTIFR